MIPRHLLEAVHTPLPEAALAAAFCALLMAAVAVGALVGDALHARWRRRTPS